MKRLFPLSLSARLLVTFVTLVALGLGALILIAGTRLAQQTRTQAEQVLFMQAQTIANGVRDPFERAREGQPESGRSLDALVSSYGQQIGATVTLLGPDKRVLVSSNSAYKQDEHDDGPELEESEHGTTMADVRQGPAGEGDQIFVAAPVIADRGGGGGLLGYVQLSAPLSSLNAEINRMWLNLLGIGLAVLLAAAVASILLARQIVAPVERLTATSEKIATGRLDERVAPGGPREIRQMGLTFNEMADRVQEMMARQRSFVDNAAHELRTPLTGLSLRLELLRAQGEKNPTLVREFTGQMSRQVAALRRTVDHLLALASAEASAAAPHSPLDLAPLLYDLADEMGAVAKQAELTLHVEVPDHLPRVDAHAEQISIAVRNLLDNAIKYTPEGGSVTLGAQPCDAAVEISVADTGPGISRDALPHIFERFYRVENKTRPQGGAGLGLALVEAIAKAHGGKVTVKSEAGKGSTFTLELPKAENVDRRT